MSELEKTLSPSEDLTRLVREGQALARGGDLVRAEAIFRTAIAQSPGSLAAVTGLVKILEARGDRAESESLIRSLIATAPTHANVLAASRQWEAWEANPNTASQSKTLRAALTGSGTLTPLGSYLRVGCAQIGLQPAVYVSEFNQWAQDLLPPHSALYEFNPELIVLLLDPGLLFPKSISEAFLPTDEVAAEREAGVKQIEELLAAIRSNAPSAAVLLHTFATPNYSPLGILDLKMEGGQTARIQAINSAVADLVRGKFAQVMLFDQERVESRHGKDRVRDERLWYMASSPFSETFLPVLAAEYMRFIRPLKGLTRKCIVLDLDNTLWGGVIGEDGINHIKLGGSASPGNAFYDFQRALKALSQRGILLAINSKNNPEEAWQAIDEHPEMALRRSDFAAARINWRDKASNILEIARELNIGLDSLVFFDDNPMERGIVRQQLPDVLVVELPRDPALYTSTLLALDVFETLALTEEDQRRGALYKEQQERKSFEESSGAAGDLSGYLRALEMVVTLASATPFTLPRIAQLINKTNQFNMTTRRYTEAQVEAMANTPGEWGIYSVTMQDRFGDNGLTGVTIVRKQQEIWEIDSFLLSCRILGRGIEDALLTHVILNAQAAGAKLLRGVFIPTSKNAPAESFFEKMGLENKGQGTVDGEIIWELPLQTTTPAREFPGWLAIRLAEEK